MKTITFESMNAHQRRRIRILREALLKGEIPPKVDWDRVHELGQHRERALARLLRRAFRQGLCVIEGGAKHSRYPGKDIDALSDTQHLSELLASRAIGWGLPIHFTTQHVPFTYD